MKSLARLIANRATAWTIVSVVLILAALAVMSATRVEHEDDILAFLPRDNPEVEVFSQINKKFGGLDVALVGVEADDVLTADFLTRLRKVTTRLKETRGLDHVMSLANMVDFTPDQDKGGVVSSLLVDEIPGTPAQGRALKARVMSRDHLVGNLISADGKAVLIYCYLAFGTDPKLIAGQIQNVVRKGFPKNRTTFGGGPFISTYIYTTTQDDMRRLTPWAVLAIVVIMMVAFRDFIGTFLAMISTAIGIVYSLGLMAVLGVKFNIVLSSMPVILFAIGSAYGIHILARYYTLIQKTDSRTAIVQTVTGVGPVVLAAGLTTVAGLLSFLMMDIQPIRTFGLFTALGILFTLLLSLTFIPAVARLVNLRRRPTRSLVLRRLMVRFTVFAQRHRAPLAVILALVAVSGGALALQVDTRMDPSTFFSRGSPPDRAERFLRKHFGGSQFIQIQVKGDMNSPAVLREVRLLADRISLHPVVSSVLHVGAAVSQINQVMVGDYRIPDRSDQAGLLFSLLIENPAVDQLVTRDRKQALLHIKVNSNQAADLEPLLTHLEQMIRDRAITRYRVVPVEQKETGELARRRQAEVVQARILAAARQQGVVVDAAARAQLTAWMKRPAASADREKVVSGVKRFLRSGECSVELPATVDGTTDPVDAVARAAVSLGPRKAPKKTEQDGEIPTDTVLAKALGKTLKRPAADELVDDLAYALAGPLEEIWRRQLAAARAGKIIGSVKLELPRGARRGRFLAAMKMALLDLDAPTAMLPAASDGAGVGNLEMVVNGLPVMHRGLSRSVTSNQIKSLAFALTLIVLIMSVLFRSFWTGLMVATPTLLTLLVIYGGMGVLGVRLDIGTSMLASLILGAGVDYAVHLTAAWHGPEGAAMSTSAANAADCTGPAIWTNAIMVGAGFFVLTLGQARPLQNVGGLTAGAMITAAVATFLLIPTLARRRTYSKFSSGAEDLESSAAVEAVLGKTPGNETSP